MKNFRFETPIEAPPERVFAVISNCSHYAEAIPQIAEIEILSPQSKGLGTRFREMRGTGRRKSVTELEVTGYEEGYMIRLESTAGGAVWDSHFTVEADDAGGSVLVLEMKAYDETLLSKLAMPFLRPMIRRAVRKDMAAVKAYCEGGARQDSGEGSGAA